MPESQNLSSLLQYDCMTAAELPHAVLLRGKMPAFVELPTSIARLGTWVGSPIITTATTVLRVLLVVYLCDGRILGVTTYCSLRGRLRGLVLN